MSAQGYDDNTLTPARVHQQRNYYGDQRGPEVMNRSNASLHQDPRGKLLTMIRILVEDWWKRNIYINFLLTYLSELQIIILVYSI